MTFPSLSRADAPEPRIPPFGRRALPADERDAAIRDLEDVLEEYGGCRDDETPAAAMRRLLEVRDEGRDRIRELLARYDLEGSDAVDDVRLFVAAVQRDYGEIRDIIGRRDSDDEGALTDLVREKIEATKAEVERLAASNAGLRARVARVGDALAAIRAHVEARGGFREQESIASAIDRLFMARAEETRVFRLRAEKAEADYMAVAEALGRVHEPDGHASKPASAEALVERARELMAIERWLVESDAEDVAEAAMQEIAGTCERWPTARIIFRGHALCANDSTIRESIVSILRNLAARQAPSAAVEDKPERWERLRTRLIAKEEDLSSRTERAAARGAFRKAAKLSERAYALRCVLTTMADEA